jgi:thiol-disulfide isomerase/thioredoxin
VRKKLALIIVAVVVVPVITGYVMYLRNTAPVTPPVSSAEASNPTKPFVVKVHAQWCAVCMLTTSVWTRIEGEYAGRVNFLVMDFTDDRTTETSGVEAERVGLGRVFEETGATGVVLIVNGRTKEIMATIAGSRDFEDYRVAIDAALKAAQGS